jgi:hypothetical protein
MESKPHKREKSRSKLNSIQHEIRLQWFSITYHLDEFKLQGLTFSAVRTGVCRLYSYTFNLSKWDQILKHCTARINENKT